MLRASPHAAQSGQLPKDALGLCKRGPGGRQARLQSRQPPAGGPQHALQSVSCPVTDASRKGRVLSPCRTTAPCMPLVPPAPSLALDRAQQKSRSCRAGVAGRTTALASPTCCLPSRAFVQPAMASTALAAAPMRQICSLRPPSRPLPAAPPLRRPRRRAVCLASGAASVPAPDGSSSNGAGAAAGGNGAGPAGEVQQAGQQQQGGGGFFGWLKAQQAQKAKLASLGLAAVLAYGEPAALWGMGSSAACLHPGPWPACTRACRLLSVRRGDPLPTCLFFAGLFDGVSYTIGAWAEGAQLATLPRLLQLLARATCGCLPPQQRTALLRCHLPLPCAAFALAFLGYEARTGLNPTQNVADIVKIWCAAPAATAMVTVWAPAPSKHAPVAFQACAPSSRIPLLPDAGGRWPT